MTNDATRVSGKVLPEINRRDLLKSAGAGAATASAVAIPSIVEAAEAEHPAVKMRRLTRELSAGPEGKWNATVYPAGSRDCPVVFGHISANEWPRHHVTLPCQEVIEAHKQARVAFGKAINASGVLWGAPPSNAAERRCDKASRAEEDALVAVCAFRPFGRADAKAKAEYLTDFARRDELRERHIIALVNAGVRS